ncbi:phosphoprotein [paper mulberry mosaic associated virus]|uniref:Phosphoprotein n=1 Tax=paper mulberry mosaic associated virus TaxID=3071215 RepID=A0AAE7JLT2_9RHAB|nr:phosphoprotein [paper mulberry mosaic associated virus]QNO38991.1 phosphoprotein [paper mulberry mosaic associated virus]
MSSNQYDLSDVTVPEVEDTFDDIGIFETGDDTCNLSELPGGEDDDELFNDENEASSSQTDERQLLSKMRGKETKGKGKEKTEKKEEDKIMKASKKEVEDDEEFLNDLPRDGDCDEEMGECIVTPHYLNQMLDKKKRDLALSAHKEYQTILIRELNKNKVLYERDVDFFLMGVTCQMNCSYFNEINEILKAMRVESEHIKKVGKEVKESSQILKSEIHNISASSDLLRNTAMDLCKPKFSSPEMKMSHVDDGSSSSKTMDDVPDSLLLDALEGLGLSVKSMNHPEVRRCAKKYFNDKQLNALRRGIKEDTKKVQKEKFLEFVKKEMKK